MVAETLEIALKNKSAAVVVRLSDLTKGLHLPQVYAKSPIGYLHICQTIEECPMAHSWSL